MLPVAPVLVIQMVPVHKFALHHCVGLELEAAATEALLPEGATVRFYVMAFLQDPLLLQRLVQYVLQWTVLGVKVQGFDLKGLTLRFKLFNLEGQKRSSG